MTANRWLLSLAGLLFFLAARPALAAESYDNCTGFIDSVPVHITTQGTWCMRANLSTSITSGQAISIGGNNITIDCNGFKLGGLGAGPGTQTTAIYAYGKRNITVRQCNVRGFFIGINLVEGAGYLVEDNLVEETILRGIGAIGYDSRVQRNRVFRNGWPDAIAATGDVIDNTVDGANTLLIERTSYAIAVQDALGAQVRGNIVRGVNMTGAFTVQAIRVIDSPASTVAGNHVVSKVTGAGTGILVNDASGGPGSFCVDNTLAGFETSISGCLASDNASH